MQDKEIQELIEKIKKYANDADVSLVEKAYYFGKKAHDGQFRKSGEPYFIHPVAVANILCDMELDIETIIAGLLHDVVEDTEYTYEDIEREFSKEIADLVDGVTKLGQIKYQSKEEKEAHLQQYEGCNIYDSKAADAAVVIDGNRAMAEMKAQIDAFYAQAEVEILTAESKEACIKKYEETIAQMDKMGLRKLEVYEKEQYRKAKERLP